MCIPYIERNEYRRGNGDGRFQEKSDGRNRFFGGQREGGFPA